MLRGTSVLQTAGQLNLSNTGAEKSSWIILQPLCTSRNLLLRSWPRPDCRPPHLASQELIKSDMQSARRLPKMFYKTHVGRRAELRPDIGSIAVRDRLVAWQSRVHNSATRHACCAAADADFARCSLGPAAGEACGQSRCADSVRLPAAPGEVPSGP